MDLANSASPTPNPANCDAVQRGNNDSEPVKEDLEVTCWGCGLRLLVSPSVTAFKCGWCGAITRQNVVKDGDKHCWWRQLRDRCFVTVVLLFILCFICTGIWTICPVTFTISFSSGVLHLIISVMLSISTLSFFCLAAFCPAGSPPLILWGSYPTVGKGGLENHTFCHYCSKPKAPRVHHCRSCGICILDMDHHCPFIGNCVGSANHRVFIFFLISAVISMIYVAVMTSYTALYIWPLPAHRLSNLMHGSVNRELIFRVFKEEVFAILGSAVFLSIRGLVLVYLFIASISVGLGLTVLLWQQLGYIYVGKTYLSHLSAVNSDELLERDCRNFVRFFGCPQSAAAYLPSYWKSRKSHVK